MRSLRVLAIGIIFIGLIGLGLFAGCSRTLFKPTSPAVVKPSATPTNTPSVTATSTPSATPTPTLDYHFIIDDFKGTGGGGSDSVSQIYVIQDENGHWRDGGWSVSNDVGVTTILLGTGVVDPNAIEQNVTFNPTGLSGYDQLIFTFTNPAGTHNAGITYYDATVGGRYTGISFWAKVKTMPSTICNSTVPFWVDFVDNGAVTDHSVAVPFTTSWQQFTVYFNQAGWDQGEDANSTALNPASIQFIKFEPQNLGTNNFNIDFLIDDILLIKSASPAAPTAPSSNLITDLDDGANHVIFHNGGPFYSGAASPWSGYWYDFEDTNGVGTSECPNGAVSGTVIFPDSPGCNGNPSSPGDDPQNFAIHFWGVDGTPCTLPPYANCPFAGMGFNFLNPGGPYDVSAFSNSDSHGIQFYVKWGASWNSSYASGFWLKFPEAETATAAEGGNCTPIISAASPPGNVTIIIAIIC